MNKKDLNNLVIHKSKEPTIKWIPEDYKFERSTTSEKAIWYKDNLELRALAKDYWLLRKRIKNDRGNSEMLFKWTHWIPGYDKEFADIIFTRGLK